MVQEVKLSRRGVIYAIKKLEAKGLIRVVKKGRKNHYQIFDYLFKMASTSKGAKSALIDWIGADFNKTDTPENLDRCIQVHQHINYTINNTTITNFLNTTGEKIEPDYQKQMRKDFLASGRYRV